MPGVEPINLRVTATASGLKSELGAAQNYIRTFAQQVEGQNRQISSALGSLSGSLRSLISLPTLLAGGGLGFGLKLAADAEQTAVAFRVLLGSAERAKQVLGELNEFAAKTPFNLLEIQQAGRLLLAFGFSAEELNDQLTVMGNLAAGTNQPIGELAELIGKARVQNQIFSEDLNQLTGRGINVLDGLAKRFGVTTDQVKKLASESKIQFSDLNAVLQQLAGEGGQFGGLMEAQSKTAAGAFSSLTDNIKTLTSNTASVFLPQLTALIKSLNEGVESLQSMDASTVRTTANIVVFTGAFTATLAIIPKVISAVRSIIASLRALAAATISIQALSGPKGWAVLAASVAVAAGAVYALNASFDEFDKQANTAQSLANAQTKVAENSATAANNVKALADATKAENDALAKQIELLKDVHSLTLPSALIRDSGAELQARMKQALQSIRRVDTGERNTGLLEEANKHLRDIKSELRNSNSTPPLHVI